MKEELNLAATKFYTVCFYFVIYWTRSVFLSRVVCMKCNKILEIPNLSILGVFPSCIFFLQISVTDHLPSLNNWQVKAVPYFQKFNIKYQYKVSAVFQPAAEDNRYFGLWRLFFPSIHLDTMIVRSML